MSPNFRNLYLDRDNIENLIEEFCCNIFDNYFIEGPIEINPSSNQYRYIIKGDQEFKLDVYFKNNKKTTLSPIGRSEENYSENLCTYILENSSHTEAPATIFSTPLEKEYYDLLIDYFNECEGLEVTKKIDNQKITLYQYISNIGDKITLTYYKSTNKLLVQGKMMKLYIEVKDFLSRIPSEIVIIDRIKDDDLNKFHIDGNNIKNELKELLPNAYDGLHDLLVDFLHDSLVYKQLNIPVREYSTYVFSALKALEGYIKILFLEVDIKIKRSFSTKPYDSRDWLPCFVEGVEGYTINLENTEMEPLKDNSTLMEALEDCYTYYNKYRHNLFHTEQAVELTTTIETKAEADRIIYEIFELIDEKYYNIYLK